MKRVILSLAILGILGGAGYLGYVGYQKYNASDAAKKWDEIKAIEKQGIAATGEIGRLLRDMDDRSADVQFAAAEALGRLGEKAVPHLREKLRKGDKAARYFAAYALCFVGPDAAPAVEELVVCATDTAPDVRSKAIYALGKIGTSSPSVIDAIVVALDDKDMDVSQTAQEAMQSIGPAGKAPLYQALAKAKGASRGRILAAVGSQGAPPKEAAPVLIEMVEAGEQAIRLQAARLLGQLGEDALPTFKKLLLDDDKNTRALGVEAFPKLDDAGKKLLPELGSAMARADDFGVAHNGALACKALDGAGAATLAKLLNDDFDAKTCQWTPAYLGILGEIGAPAKVAVPALVRYLLGADPNHVNQALEALASIGPAAREAALPALEKLRAKEPSLGPRIDEAMRRMGVIAAKDDKK